MIRRFRSILGAAAGLVAAAAVLSGATDDRRPVLVSTGGWSNLADLRKAAEAHDPKASFEYGDALVKGDGVPQDVARGLAFLKEAAAAGESNALFRLGKIYDDGVLVPQDYPRALEAYAAAAKAGVAEAQYNLGVLYATGRGTARDYVEGLAWLIVAEKNGAPGDGARRTREQLLKLHQPEAIRAAEKRAAEILAPAAAAPSTVEAPKKIDLGAGTSAPELPNPEPAALPALAPGEGLPPPSLPAVTPAGSGAAKH